MWTRRLAGPTPQLAETPLERAFADAAAAHEQAIARCGEVRRDLVVSDRRFSLRFAGAPLAEALLAPLAPRIEEPTSTEATIGLWAGSLPSSWLPGDLGPQARLRWASPNGINAIYEAASGALTIVDRGRAQVLYRVPDVDGIPWWERAAPLRPALSLALAGPGRHLVHGAVVGHPGRGGVLLAGPGGAGKTTLALAAVDHGLRYVGDDYVLLADGVAWNLYATAKVDNGAGEEKSVVTVADSSLIEALPVRAVVVPAIGARRTRLQEISAVEALLALGPSTALQMPFDRPAVLATLADLVRRVQCYRLELGSSNRSSVRAIETVLERA